ncbi:hypothetical protein GGH92_005056, partial [Coemansia sp. RSA 2673]
MEPVNDSTTAHTNFEKTDAQQVIKHVSNFEAVAQYENPDLWDLMAAHALLSLTGALTTVPSIQHDSTGSNAVLAAAASTASSSTAVPVMPIQDTSIITSAPATVPVVTAPPYCGMYSTITPSNLGTGPLVQYHFIGFGTHPASSLHGAHAHTCPTALLHGVYSTVTPSNLSTGLSVQYRVTNSDAVLTSSHHSANAHTPANVNPGPSIEPHCANTDAAPANSAAGPSVKRHASNLQQPKCQRANLWEGSMIVISSDSGEGTSNTGQDVPTTIIRDSKGKDVTLAWFSSLFKQFIFLRVDMILIIYLQLVSRELAATPASLQELYKQLETISRFEIWAHRAANVSGLILVHQGPVYMQMRQKLQLRLRITDEAQAGVMTAPVLYFHVVTIGCIHAKQLTDTILLPMFNTVAGCDLGLWWIILKDGPRSFSGTEYCRLAQGWLFIICEYIIKDDRMESLLTTADDCYKAYEKTGHDRGNKGIIFDPDGSIGQEILQSNDLALKLVIGLSYMDMLELYEILPCM